MARPAGPAPPRAAVAAASKPNITIRKTKILEGVFMIIHLYPNNIVHTEPDVIHQ
jgi:hypothetical protein